MNENATFRSNERPEHAQAFAALMVEAARRVIEDGRHPAEVIREMWLIEAVKALSGRI